jgi:preprotein translocase subunit SecD
MGAKIQRRAILIFAVTIAGLYIVLLPHDRLPGGKDFTSLTQVRANLSKNIHLGLDLRGGSHLVMQVKADDVIEQITQKNIEVAKHTLNEKDWKFNDLKQTGKDEITITVPDRSKNSDIISQLNTDFGSGWKASEIGNTITYKLDQTEQNGLRERATAQAMQIIDNRINAFGVAESTIQRQGSNDQYEILLEMPGVDDPERVKATLNAESHLDLKPVAKGTQNSPPYPTEEAARAAMATLPGGPDNYEILPIHDKRGAGEGFLILEKNPVGPERRAGIFRAVWRRELSDQFPAHAGRFEAIRRLDGGTYQ